VPLVNTRYVSPLGERTPGLYTVAFLEKPDALTYDEWLQRWQGQHTALAIATQSTFLYIQNVLVRALTAGAPPWVAIVEEAFPAEAATDPMVFYDAGGSPERLQEHQRRMMASCERFIDFNRFETYPMSAYVLQR
jgi:EthD domain